MATIKQFEDIQAWITARKLSKEVFHIFQSEPAKWDFPLKDQVNSSLGSVMDNIAEGFERGGSKEFIQFLFISKGSSGESRSQIYRMFDRGYISEEEFDRFIGEILGISRQIMGLIMYLKKSEIKGDKYKKG